MRHTIIKVLLIGLIFLPGVANGEEVSDSVETIDIKLRTAKASLEEDRAMKAFVARNYEELLHLLRENESELLRKGQGGESLATVRQQIADVNADIEKWSKKVTSEEERVAAIEKEKEALLLPFADADVPIANRTQVETAFARELRHATDIAIVSRLSSGGYRVLSVIKGEGFAAVDHPEFGSSIFSSSRIPDGLREEPRLLVWQAGNQPSVADIALPRASIGAAPLSASGEVAVSSEVKVSLVSILARFRPIKVGSPMPHPAAVGPELANKPSRTNGR